MQEWVSVAPLALWSETWRCRPSNLSKEDSYKDEHTASEDISHLAIVLSCKQMPEQQPLSQVVSGDNPREGSSGPALEERRDLTEDNSRVIANRENGSA